MSEGDREYPTSTTTHACTKFKSIHLARLGKKRQTTEKKKQTKWTLQNYTPLSIATEHANIQTLNQISCECVCMCAIIYLNTHNIFRHIGAIFAYGMAVIRANDSCSIFLCSWLRPSARRKHQFMYLHTSFEFTTLIFCGKQRLSNRKREFQIEKSFILGKHRRTMQTLGYKRRRSETRKRNINEKSIQ